MNKLTTIFLLFSVLLSSSGLFAQDGVYDVRLNQYAIDYVNLKYYVDIEVKAFAAGTAFNISDQNYRFRYNRALSNPQIEEELELSGIVDGSFYLPHTLTGSTVSDSLVSYNAEMAGGPGVLLDEFTYVKVGRLVFDIENENACISLEWNTHDPVDFPPTFVGEKYNNILAEAEEGAYNNWSGCLEVGLKLYVFLEGAFDPVTQFMSTYLYEHGLLPGQTPTDPSAVATLAGQPFNQPPWNYTGSENSTYSPSVVDWIMVELREDSSRSSVIYQSPALLHRDGRIALLGQAMPTSHPNPLYIFLSHRSHMAVLLETPFEFGGAVLDMRYQQMNTNPSIPGQKEIAPNIFALYAGDLEKNGGTDINGADRIKYTQENGYFSQYSPADMNFDGEVNLLDKIFWTENNAVYGQVEN